MELSCETCTYWWVEEKACTNNINCSQYSEWEAIAEPTKPVIPLLLKAPTILKKAADLLEERGKDYDNGEERSMFRAVGAFNCVTGLKLTETQGWLLMQCVKLVRQQNAKGFHQDSYEDDVAYAALKAEAASRESDT